MADRYVNYDKLLEERCRLGLDEMSMIHKVNALNQFIDHLPTADVVEVKHGEWLLIVERSSYLEPPYCDTAKCSICGFKIDFSETYFKRCPNCGAKMDGVNRE